MQKNINCPFCSFETPWPVHGKISECLGECYSTYTLARAGDDPTRIRMRLVEIFFLDDQFTSRITADEIDPKCEFRSMPAEEPGESIIFAREKRVEQTEIDNLREEARCEHELFFADELKRLHSSIDRFERDLRTGGREKEKLLNNIKVVEKIVRIIREKLENPQ